MAGADHLQFAALRFGLYSRIPCRVADRPRGVAPLGRFLHGRADRRLDRARLSGRAGAFSALLCRRQSRALRTRSADVFRAAAALRLPVVDVHFPLSYVVVNREPYDLDPRVFSGRLPSFANTRSMRVAGGLGTIPRVVGDGQEIYRDRILVDDALARIETLYKPYHRALRRLINKTHQTFGTVVLVDR